MSREAFKAAWVSDNNFVVVCRVLVVVASADPAELRALVLTAKVDLVPSNAFFESDNDLAASMSWP